MNKSLNFDSLYQYSISLLARRDYSSWEIQNKLNFRFHVNQRTINSVIEKLKNQQYLDDQRFCQNYIYYLQLKNYGPFLIQKHLEEKKISHSIIQIYLDFEDHIWENQAKALLKKKKYHQAKKNPLQAMYSFLYQKGYTNKQIQSVLSCIKNEKPKN